MFMRAVKKIFLIILPVFIFTTFTVFAVGEVIGTVNTLTKNVVVQGQLLTGQYDSNTMVSVFLIKKGVNIADIESNSGALGHIGVTSVNENGKYIYKFKFNGNADDYMLYARAGNLDVTESIIAATATNETMTVDLDITNALDSRYISTNEIAKAKANIFNLYGDDDKSYVLALVSYSAEGKLLGCSISQPNQITYDAVNNEGVLSAEIPNNAAKVKAFIWDSSNKIVPIANFQEKVTDNSTFYDGDKVMFIGDSITHGGIYHMLIEHFYETRFPDKTITFMNAGIGGDTASGAISRLDWDILSRSPNQVSIMFGMNDVQPGYYVPGSTVTLKQKTDSINNCLNNIETLVKEFRVKGIEVTLIGPSIYDEDPQYTTAVNKIGTNSFALKQVTVGVKNLTDKYKLPYINFYDSMNEITEAARAKNPGSLCLISSDRIHPNENGHRVMAYLFLKQHGQNSTVSNLEFDINDEGKNKYENAEVSNLFANNEGVSYDYLPNSIPMAVDSSYLAVDNNYVPFTDQLNQETIKVTGFKSGNYNIVIDGNTIETHTSDELAEGINIAISSNNPGQIQAQSVLTLDKAKYYAENALRDIVFCEKMMMDNGIDITNSGAVQQYINNIANNMGSYYVTVFSSYNRNKPNEDNLKSSVLNKAEQARQAAKPIKHNVRIELVK